MHPISLGCAIKTRKEDTMDKKTYNFLLVLAFLFAVCSTIIIFNLFYRDKKQYTTSYKPNKVFSMTVSEETWDESMMPKGKRSPKGVLYNPEK